MGFLSFKCAQAAPLPRRIGGHVPGLHGPGNLHFGAADGYDARAPGIKSG